MLRRPPPKVYPSPPPNVDKLSTIKQQILNDLHSSGKVTWTVVFNIDWDLSAFLKDQEYEERTGDEAISTAITITGFPNCAQATTTIEYLDQTWPATGRWILQVLREMAVTLREATIQNSEAQITASIQNARTIVKACGTAGLIAELGEQLAWLGSALRSSPFKKGVVCCIPRCTKIEHSSVPSYNIEFLLKQNEKVNSREGTCWHDLFRNPVIVEGFPIQIRAEHMTGLYIPLHIMAGLIRAKTATDFDERLLIKSFSALLFPTKIVGDTIIWHLLYNENGGHISYLDPRINNLQNHEARQIRLIHLLDASVHVLGWCSKANSYAGSLEANYPINPSNCGEATTTWVFDKFNISGGKYINIGASWSVGNREKGLRLWAEQPYYLQVLRLSTRFVLFYDVGDRRAWLVNGANALLHLVIASLKYEQSTAIGSKFISKVEDLKTTGEHGRANSAIDTLINKENMDRPILPGKRETVKENGELKTKESMILFSDRVEHIMDYLEKAFTYQEDKLCEPGYEMRAPSRKSLAGFDFAGIAESHQVVPRRIAKLNSAGKCWVDFVQKIRAVTLLGRGFEDIIYPTSKSASCASWKTMPTGKEYLAICVHDLKSIISRFGVRKQDDDDIQVVDGIFWNNPNKIFDDCACQAGNVACFDRAQTLLPIKFKFLRFFKRIVPPGTLEGKEEGAVIFGSSKELPIKWPDNPKEIAQEEPITPEPTNSDDTN